MRYNNTQSFVASHDTWPRPNVAYTQLQPTPSSGTQPFHPSGLPTAAMQPGDILPPPQPSCVNAPMPLRRFDDVQVQQPYVLSDCTQGVQTTPDGYGVQPMLVCDTGSLALGRIQTYSAVVDTAGKSDNLQSLAANLGIHGCTLGPHLSRIFRIVMGIWVPVSHPWGRPFLPTLQ